MNIHRRQLALPALAAGLLGLLPAVATEADEETAVAKNVEAFRAAQIATPRRSMFSARRNSATATPMAASKIRRLSLRTLPVENRGSCHWHMRT